MDNIFGVEVVQPFTHADNDSAFIGWRQLKKQKFQTSSYVMAHLFPLGQNQTACLKLARYKMKSVRQVHTCTHFHTTHRLTFADYGCGKQHFRCLSLTSTKHSVTQVTLPS